MSGRQPRILWIALALGLLLLVTQSLFSHASAAADRAAAVANDWLHLTSTALWIGGLVAFALMLLTLRREPDRTALTARLVAAFSNFARVAVVLLVVSGLYAAWLEVGAPTKRSRCPAAHRLRAGAAGQGTPVPAAAGGGGGQPSADAARAEPGRDASGSGGCAGWWARKSR